MSLDICRQENARHPEHLITNINSTCYTYLSHVIELLRGEGHEAYFICKTAGEGQFTPPGFVPFTGPGLDGKPYTYTGVSHDALWCDGKQFDTAARANDSPDPIFNPDGSHMTAEPVWNEIPQANWRPQNPPLKESTPTQPPVTLYPYPDEPTYWKRFQDRMKSAYNAVGRLFPDPNDADAFRRFSRCGYDDHTQDATAMANKHIGELRQELGAPPECRAPVPGTDSPMTPPLACLLSLGHAGEHK